MKNEFSIEELILEGTGLKKVVNQNNSSFESRETTSYCGCTDAIIKDVAQASEDLKFIDIYEKINKKSCSDKMHMLNRIKNVYSNNCYNKKAKQTMESYIYNNMLSTEEEAQNTGSTTTNPNDANSNGNNGANAASNGAAQKAEQMKKEAGKKKGGWFKKIITAVKNFIMKIVNFIKMLINKVLTYFKSLSVDPDKYKINPKNPLTEKGDIYYNFSGFNFSGAKAFCKVFEHVQSKLNEHTTGGEISKEGEGDLASFFNQLKSKVKFDWEEGEKEKLKASISWKLFGLKMCGGEESYKSANPRKLALLSQEMQAISTQFQNVNDMIDKSLGNLLKLAEDLESGKITEIDNKFVSSANKAATTTATNIQKNTNYQNGTPTGSKLGIIPTYGVSFNVDGTVVNIFNSKNVSDMLKNLQKVVSVTNIGSGICFDVLKIIGIAPGYRNSKEPLLLEANIDPDGNIKKQNKENAKAAGKKK